MNKREKNISNLEGNSIIASFEIECSKCEKNDDISVDDIEQASKHFYEEGWRSTDNATYCKRCAKKFRVK